MENLLNSILSIVIIPLLPIIGVLLGSYLRMLTLKVKAQLDNEVAEQYIDLLETIIYNVVQEINQTIVDGLKANQVGGLTEEQKVALLLLAKDKVYTILTDTQKEILLAVYGDLDEYIRTLIESNVRLSKLS